MQLPRLFHATVEFNYIQQPTGQPQDDQVANPVKRPLSKLGTSFALAFHFMWPLFIPYSPVHFLMIWVGSANGPYAAFFTIPARRKQGRKLDAGRNGLCTQYAEHIQLVSTTTLTTPS